MKTFLSTARAAVLAAAVGFAITGVSAQAASMWWSVAVHLEYPDGTIADYVYATHVPTSRMAELLRDCARSHAYASGVRFHCYPVAE